MSRGVPPEKHFEYTDPLVQSRRATPEMNLNAVFHLLLSAT